MIHCLKKAETLHILAYRINEQTHDRRRDNAENLGYIRAWKYLSSRSRRLALMHGGGEPLKALEQRHILMRDALYVPLTSNRRISDQTGAVLSW